MINGTVPKTCSKACADKIGVQTYKENCENKKNEIVNSIKEIKKLLGEQSKDWKSVSNCLNDLIKITLLM